MSSMMPSGGMGPGGVSFGTRIKSTDIYPERIAMPGGPLNRWLVEAANTVRVAARKYLESRGRVETGALKRSLKITYPTPFWSGHRSEIEVYTDKPYALFVHDGTKQVAPIYPRSAQAMVFTPKASRRSATGQFQSGSLVFAREVKGQEKTPFLEEAIKVLRARPPAGFF